MFGFASRSSVAPAPGDDLDAGLRKLARRYRHDVHTVRLAHLDRRLREQGALAVRHNTWGFSNDRASIELDDDTVLRLKLFWPRRGALAAVLGLTQDPRIGWIVHARTTAGTPMRCFAWMASLEPATPRRR